MRIIAGRLRRRSIRALKGRLMRPTTDRVREAIFSLIESRLALDEADVLDAAAEQGKGRLEHLRRHGPTPEAFTFKQPFAVPVEMM